MEEIPQYVVNATNIAVIILSVFLTISVGFLINYNFSIEREVVRRVYKYLPIWVKYQRSVIEDLARNYLFHHNILPRNYLTIAYTFIAKTSNVSEKLISTLRYRSRLMNLFIIAYAALTTLLIFIMYNVSCYILYSLITDDRFFLIIEGSITAGIVAYIVGIYPVFKRNILATYSLLLDIEELVSKVKGEPKKYWRAAS